jgi:hypothetical protein
LPSRRFTERSTSSNHEHARHAMKRVRRIKRKSRSESRERAAVNQWARVCSYSNLSTGIQPWPQLGFISFDGNSIYLISNLG